MNDRYEVRLLMDRQYAVYDKYMEENVYTGSLPEVNAWLDLKAKGFDV